MGPASRWCAKFELSAGLQDAVADVGKFCEIRMSSFTAAMRASGNLWRDASCAMTCASAH